MKKLLISIAGLLPCIAMAQLVTLGPFAVYQNVASNVPITSTIKFDTRGQQNIAIEWLVKHSGTATTLEGCSVRPSVDGSNAIGENVTITITPASATTVTLCTNIQTYGYPWMIVNYITNKDADTYSTNWFKYYLKRNAP